LQIIEKGQFKELIIDDYVPCYYGSNRPVFCKPNGNEVWVMLLEKAWAKLSGSYGNIWSGYSHEVLSSFLVSPCFYYEISNSSIKKESESNLLWKEIYRAMKEGRVVCAGSRQNFTCKGIKTAFTYSIIDA
jgi:calpain-15